MPRIVFIGAGSVVFTRNLVKDVLTFDELDGSEIVLMDINRERLDKVRQLVEKLAAFQGRRITVRATEDRREALRGADYVVFTIQVGGIQAWDSDIQIPFRYGVSQCVGDTLGPGGIFRGLRHLAVLDGVAADMQELCPDALLLQYSNPMAILTGEMTLTPIRTVGLCHSVQGTAHLLAGYCGVPFEELTYLAAGINHQAWFLRLEHHGRDLYPVLRTHLENPETMGLEPVRLELMRRFGYFVTESSGHASEYYPYFRKRPDLLDALVDRFTKPERHSAWFDYARTGGCVTMAKTREVEYERTVQNQIAGTEPLEVTRSEEYGARIIHAMETGGTIRINGNVANHGVIPNLPDDACVEVPCLVDRAGVHPCYVGKLPPQLAALNRASIAVQELTRLGHRHRDPDLVVDAVAMDPLTAAVLTLDEIWEMTRAMFEANASWLPQFGGRMPSTGGRGGWR